MKISTTIRIENAATSLYSTEKYADHKVSIRPISEPAQHRAGQRADAAEHRGGEGLDAGDEAHEEIDQAVIEQVHHAGDRGERRADHEGHGDGAIDIDAEQRRHGLVLFAGAHVAPEPGPRHQPGEDRQQHDGGDDDDDLHVGQPHHEAVAPHTACSRR